VCAPGWRGEGRRGWIGRVAERVCARGGWRIGWRRVCVVHARGGVWRGSRGGGGHHCHYLGLITRPPRGMRGLKGDGKEGGRDARALRRMHTHAHTCGRASARVGGRLPGKATLAGPVEDDRTLRKVHVDLFESRGLRVVVREVAVVPPVILNVACLALCGSIWMLVSSPAQLHSWSAFILYTLPRSIPKPLAGPCGSIL
jgi:hypothetical protein